MPEVRSCPERFTHEVPSWGLAAAMRARTLAYPHLKLRRVALCATPRATRDRGTAWKTQAATTHTTLVSGPPPGEELNRRGGTVTQSRSTLNSRQGRARKHGMNSGPASSPGFAPGWRRSAISTTTRRPRNPLPRPTLQTPSVGLAARSTTLAQPRSQRVPARVITKSPEAES